MTIQRRDFLLGAGALIAGSTFAHAGARLHGLVPRRELAPRRLVWVELKGGNDGLNAFPYHGDDAYYRARPKLGLKGDDLLEWDDHLGFHASLAALHRRALEGKVGFVHGVGYPGPNLSHFKSTDVWHTGDLSGRNAGKGWMAKLAEAAHPGAPDPDRLVHVGRSLPYSMVSADHPAVSFVAPRDYRYAKREGDLEKLGEKAGRSGNSRMDFLRGVMNDARISSASIRAAVESHVTDVEYPATDLGRSLKIVAGLLDSSVTSEVISVTHDGFDTHNDQVRRQRNVLNQLDEALDAFLTEIEAKPSAANTLVVMSSEFGRRVAENGSAGTDHGTAAPVLFAGPRAKGGQFGKKPSLTDLDERGNLRFTTDFRKIHATVARDLFGVDPKAVLGKRFGSVGCVS